MDEPAFICISLAGRKKRERVPVRVIGRSSDKYRCRLLVDVVIPGNRLKLKGETILVPAYAVIFEYPQPEQLNLIRERKD